MKYTVVYAVDSFVPQSTFSTMNFMMLILSILIHKRDKRMRATTQQQVEGERVCHSRYRKQYLKRLRRFHRRIRQRKIPRVSLQNPCDSSWRTLLLSRNDQSLITLTGLDFETFEWLAERFGLLFDTHSPFVDPNGNIAPLRNVPFGRPRKITAKDCLGLSLAWTRTRGSNMVLQIIFGMTGTSVSMYLRFGRRILIKALRKEPDCAIRVPDATRIQLFQECIKERHPALQDVWCTMDGLKLYLQPSSDCNTQNNFYNGWTHDHYVGAVIVFCPDGTIPICCYNVPGSVHDSMIAEMGNVYNKLEKVYEQTGGKCTVDSAFSKRTYPFLIKSGPSNEGQGETRQEFRENARLQADATSMRQSAEWGMRSLQASFPRLKERFIYEEHGERKLIMKSMLLLYNLRARKVGINQIRNTYLPALDVNVDDIYRRYRP